jgi:hypothetical protein
MYCRDGLGLGLGLCCETIFSVSCTSSQYHRVNVSRLKISDAAKLHPQSFVTTKLFLNILQSTSSSICSMPRRLHSTPASSWQVQAQVPRHLCLCHLYPYPYLHHVPYPYQLRSSW